MAYLGVVAERMIIALLLITAWDTSEADIVIWNEDNTEVFIKQGEKYGGGECEDLVRDGNCIKYYWRDKSGSIICTRVKHVFMVVRDNWIEIDENTNYFRPTRKVARGSP